MSSSATGCALTTFAGFLFLSRPSRPRPPCFCSRGSRPSLASPWTCSCPSAFGLRFLAYQRPQIQNLYHSDVNSNVKLTYGYLKEYAEEWIEDFCAYEMYSSWCVEDLSTYENISLINENASLYDYLSLDDLKIQIYLRFYNKDNFKENMFNYARSLCHSQGVY